MTYTIYNVIHKNVIYHSILCFIMVMCYNVVCVRWESIVLFSQRKIQKLFLLLCWKPYITLKKTCNTVSLTLMGWLSLFIILRQYFLRILQHGGLVQRAYLESYWSAKHRQNDDYSCVNKWSSESREKLISLQKCD